ncbi:helix-turn-helix domain-containing protein [Nocardioides sp. dk4132]|uniref:helix-turn-helix domain-containing protein n=1 Tax=unclassified Nocardioides TaxID=2615069 RepID=UPI0012974F83|nr:MULTISPECIES: helix-turn-helix transcriptional regulator [unclassified Nocardioides]MQW77028.1 helix-turn-helix domain-containing protein [Nocardioides sp. dk4132]QGA09437.1 helix-turn-helix domain-containing protein [Nocardioides sp. dk884]
MSTTPNALGEYLRARRGLVTPQQAGIPDVGPRRVPGLRREEVAMLAGISADYYLRLERGRDRNPSVQVLDALARVLRLDETHLAHLRGLACEQPRRRRPRPRPETVPAGTLTLLASLPHPAYVEGRRFDILAANPLAEALSPRFAAGRNQLRDMFLDPADQALHPDWEGSTACLIASLRQSVGTDIDDPRFIELVGELSLASPRFRELWARHDVKAQFGAPVRFDHPQVGELTLNRERLEISGTDRLTLVIHHPDPGTADADKLALLASAALPAAGSTAEGRVRA